MFVLNSAAVLNVSVIPLEKRLALAIRGTIDAACSSSDRVRISLTQRYGQTTISRATGELPCELEFTITGVARGEYDLAAWVQAYEVLVTGIEAPYSIVVLAAPSFSRRQSPNGSCIQFGTATTRSLKPRLQHRQLHPVAHMLPYCDPHPRN